jgi:hypothetical protein
MVAIFLKSFSENLEGVHIVCLIVFMFLTYKLQTK